MISELWLGPRGNPGLQSKSSEVLVQLEAGALGTLFQAPSFIQSRRLSALVCLSSRSGAYFFCRLTAIRMLDRVSDSTIISLITKHTGCHPQFSSQWLFLAG